MPKIVGTLLILLLLAFLGDRWYQGHKVNTLRQAEAQQLESERQAKLEAERAMDARRLAAQNGAEAALKQILKDPDSVQFRNMHVVLDYPADRIRIAAAGNTDFVCGEFNAKNAMGGYTGFERFYWDAQKNAVTTAGSTELAPFLRDMIDNICQSGLDFSKAGS